MHPDERVLLHDPARDAVGTVDLRSKLTLLLPHLRAYARFLMREPSGADDLVQEALVRALAALDQFRPDTDLKAWCFTILRNTFYEQSRRRRRETVVLAEATQDSEPIIPAPQDGGSEVRDLQKLLWSLPPLLREALVLVGAQELSYEEAGRICAVPPGTMKARVSRARRQIASLLDAQAAG